MFGTPDQLASGIFLLANPFLPDPDFKRTVILIANHDGEGSLGFVLTRPSGYTLGDVSETFQDVDIPLYFGGPVELDTLHYVHRLGREIPGSRNIAPGIWWGGDVEMLVQKIQAGDLAESSYRFFIGYAGWGAGQLVHETSEKSWIITTAADEKLWPYAPDKLWRETLRGMGSEYAIVANFPEDPRLN